MWSEAQADFCNYSCASAWKNKRQTPMKILITSYWYWMKEGNFEGSIFCITIMNTSTLVLKFEYEIQKRNIWIFHHYINMTIWVWSSKRKHLNFSSFFFSLHTNNAKRVPNKLNKKCTRAEKTCSKWNTARQGTAPVLSIVSSTLLSCLFSLFTQTNLPQKFFISIQEQLQYCLMLSVFANLLLPAALNVCHFQNIASSTPS